MIKKPRLKTTVMGEGGSSGRTNITEHLLYIRYYDKHLPCGACIYVNINYEKHLYFMSMLLTLNPAIKILGVLISHNCLNASNTAHGK